MPWLSVLVIVTMLCMAIFAPLLAPYSPIDQTLRDKLLPPFWLEGGSTKYILGTDAFGRDDLAEADVESVGEHEAVARLEVRGHLGVVGVLLLVPAVQRMAFHGK